MSTNVESNTKKHLAEKNDDTYARYNEIAIMLIRPSGLLGTPALQKV